MAGGPILCQFVDEVKGRQERQYSDLKYVLAERLKVLSPVDSFSDDLVLILTGKFDVDADILGVELLRRGIDYVRLNVEDIPAQFLIKYYVEKDFDSKTEFAVRDHVFDSSKISVVCLRHFDTKAIDVGDNELTQTFSFQQWDDAFLTMQRRLRCEWINDAHNTRKAGDRAEQLSVAKALGFDIPNTLITNDPRAGLDFYHTYDGNVILKALHHHSIEIRDKIYSMYTHTVVKDDLFRFDDLVYAPCVLQERLHKQADVRVIVVGDRIFATEIDSQSTISRGEDIHRCALRDLPKRTVELEDTVGEQCLKIISSFGLKYGAIDFVRDKNDRLIFLEVNPTGDWYWIECQTRQPVTEAVADLMEGLAACPR